MNTLQMTAIQPMKFACDSIPDCQGQIVERIGSFVIIRGMATDSGYWFAKGVGGARRFGNRQEAVDYIEYAQPTLAKDAPIPPHLLTLKPHPLAGTAGTSREEQDKKIREGRQSNPKGKDVEDGGPGSGPPDKGKGPARNKSETDKLHPKDMSRYEIERELTSVPAGSERHKSLQQHYKGSGSSNKG